MNPYIASKGYTVTFAKWMLKIITKDKLDIMEWIVYLPIDIIQFILAQQLPSPLPATVLLYNNEEVWCLVDAICYSPDEQSGFLTLKWLHYLTK